jgi:hypothetical protein
MSVTLVVNVALTICAVGMWIQCALELRKILRGDDGSVPAGPPDRRALLLPIGLGVMALAASVPTAVWQLPLLVFTPVALLFAFREGVRFQRAQATSDRG